MTNLANTLKIRVFFVTDMDDHLYLGTGNHPEDVYHLKEMFEKLQINVSFEERKIILHEHHMDDKTLE